jgi:hypothetical protein
MKLLSNFTLFVSLFVFNANANAADWYAFSKTFTDNKIFFFDRDTVVRSKETTTVWIKALYDVKSTQNDGVYTEAYRYVFDCAKRTLQALQASTYDRQGKFLKSFSEPGSPKEAVPGTVAEGLMTAVCSRRFPDDPKSDFYVRPTEQNLNQLSVEYFEDQRSKVDNAPK